MPGMQRFRCCYNPVPCRSVGLPQKNPPGMIVVAARRRFPVPLVGARPNCSRRACARSASGGDSSKLKMHCPVSPIGAIGRPVLPFTTGMGQLVSCFVEIERRTVSKFVAVKSAVPEYTGTCLSALTDVACCSPILRLPPRQSPAADRPCSTTLIAYKRRRPG